MFMRFKSESNTSLKTHTDVHGTESKVGLLGQKSHENVSLPNGFSHVLIPWPW